MRHCPHLVALALSTSLAACGGSSPPRAFSESGPLPTVQIPADHVKVRLTGRFDLRDESRPVFSYPGTELELAFEGDAVSVRLADRGSDDPKKANRYQVLVDGKPGQELAVFPKQEVYELATRLGPGQHRVALHRLTESNVGKTAFLGFVLHGKNARMADLPARPARRLEVVGDSISCGYGNEVSIEPPPRGNPATGFTPQNENHYLAYGALTARTFGAELYTECVSGIGVTRDYGGNSSNQMPDIFARTLPSDAEPGWDFARYVPDAVIVNLGTNDFGKGVPDDVTFIAAYEGFIAQLRELYPHAHLVCATGPTTSDTWPAGEGRLTKFNAWVSGVDERRNQGGDGNVSFLAFTPQKPPVGEDWHPTLVTHKKMSAELNAHLRKVLGW
jgi:lysophospholipase L1-like esterase